MISPLLLLLPYICAFNTNPADDPELSAAISLGGGSYAEVSRDCNGNVRSVTEHPYSEYAGSFRYRISNLELGVTGGQTNGFQTEPRYFYGPDGTPREEAQQSLQYLTPSIGFTTTYIGMDLGYLFSLNSQTVGLAHGHGRSTGMPSGMLRLGRLDRVHFSASLARNFPLLSGGGLLDAGLGFPVGSDGSRLWLGLGGFPYDGLVFSCKGDITLSDRFAITPTIHAKGGDAFEYGYSIGARVIF
jgi:hypothetical protein